MKFLNKSTLLLFGLMSAITLPLILVSCNKSSDNAVVPKPPVTPDPPIIPPVTPDPPIIPPVTPDPPIIPPVTPDPPIIVPPVDVIEFSKGGQISLDVENKFVLNIDGYLSVVQQLGFNKYTNISNYTNDKLNELLHNNPKFQSLNLTILEGSSQKNRTLILSLNGVYLDNSINDKTITISNFPKIYSKNSSIRVNSKSEIDKINFISDLKDETNISTLNMSDFFKYNTKHVTANFSINFESFMWDLNEIYANGFMSEMSFRNTNLNNQDWNIKIKFNEKKYLNNQWVLDEELTLPLNGYKVRLDISKAAIQVLAKKLTILSNTEKSNYASTLFIRSKIDNADWTNYIQVNEEISKKYFPESVIKIISGIDLSVNDINGTLEGTFKISDSQNVNIFAQSPKLTISNFKTTKELFSPENLSHNNNKITIIKGGNFDKNIIRDMKKPIINNEISSLEIGQSKTFNQDKFLSSFNLLRPSSNIFQNPWIEDGGMINPFEELTSMEANGFHLRLLNPTHSLLNVLSNRGFLFNNFLIKTLSISSSQNTNLVKISKESNGDYKISHKIFFEVNYMEGTQSIDVDFGTTIKLIDII